MKTRRADSLSERQPLEVELLATDDERRPMPASHDEELAQFIAELREVKPKPRRRKL